MMMSDDNDDNNNNNIKVYEIILLLSTCLWMKSICSSFLNLLNLSNFTSASNFWFFVPSHLFPKLCPLFYIEFRLIFPCHSTYLLL